MIKYIKKGFTLVEIMIVVAIVGIVVGIYAANYIKSGQASAKTVCINNLKQIDGAMERWSLDKGISPGAVPTLPQEEEIYSYIENGKPQCPSGGSYILYPTGSHPQVRCTREDIGHKLPE